MFVGDGEVGTRPSYLNKRKSYPAKLPIAEKVTQKSPFSA